MSVSVRVCISAHAVSTYVHALELIVVADHVAKTGLATNPTLSSTSFPSTVVFLLFFLVFCSISNRQQCQTDCYVTARAKKQERKHWLLKLQIDRFSLSSSLSLSFGFVSSVFPPFSRVNYEMRVRLERVSKRAKCIKCWSLCNNETFHRKIRFNNHSSCNGSNELQLH